MAAHSTASSGVVVAGGEAARFGAVLGGGLDDGGADGWLDLTALSGLRDDLISSFLWDERGAAAEDEGRIVTFKLGTLGRKKKPADVRN